jgi:hypothetical protein
MKRDDDEAKGPEDALGSYQPGGHRAPWNASEIEPWHSGEVRPGGEGNRPAENETRPAEIVVATPIGRPGERNGGKHSVVRVPRALLIVLVCLLLCAVLAVAALVVYRPARPAQAAATAKPSASTPSPGASTVQPSDSSAQASSGPGSAASASATGTANTVAAPGGGPGSAITNLSALTPVQNDYAGNFSTGPEQIGATIYSDSVRFTCEPGEGTGSDLIYNVAGYKFLNGTLGVPSDATNAAGNTATITFFKDGSTAQLGRAITISLDHPQPLRLDLQGSSQLEIACIATNATSHSSVNMDVALGNATIGPS